MTATSLQACVRFVRSLLCDQKHFVLVAVLLLFCDALLTFVVIEKVPYTEIDWKAYMQEVQGYLLGERDYKRLEGDTGPLVYPAGFVYLYSFLFRITEQGANIKLAQYLFGVVYILFTGVVFALYGRSGRVPPWVLVPLVLSKRIHSIFVLRLFNDVFAMLLCYVAILLFTYNRWSLGCVFFSLGVSIKMNVLLFAPGLLFLLIQNFGIIGCIPKLSICAIIQVVLGLPFLTTYPVSYLERSFELGRKFFFKWTVNWRFVDEELFTSSSFALLLLCLHVCGLLVFAFTKWRKQYGTTIASASAANIIHILFVSNFVGIIFARSLHYQFYVWYFHTLPFLLYTMPSPAGSSSSSSTILWFSLLLAIEACWLTFPSTNISSATLLACHVVILIGSYLSQTTLSSSSSSSQKGGAEKDKKRK
eukprot:TRINITY_DN5231_c0_g1_i2.p1 TRINITY_DN5231_c0_g1~~TRINITY_DN5231_c0_g1_i2.p1  ORF type:complete len:419 (+),score=60.15 TRINITY_DN5231_c0_g1_i2:1-1257(+)